MSKSNTLIEKWSPIVDFKSFLNENDKIKCAEKLNEIEDQFLKVDPKFTKNKELFPHFFINVINLCVEEYKKGTGENFGGVIFDGELIQTFNRNA